MSTVNKTYGGPLAEELDDLTRADLDSAPPQNTLDAYRYAHESFAKFCREIGSPICPAPESTLTRYVSRMNRDGYAPATITQHVGAIRAMHNQHGHPGEPNTYRASLLLRKYRRQLAQGDGQRQAIPIEPESLRRMIATLDVTTVKGQRDRLALTLGFCGMLRRSELVGLRVHDVTVTGDGVTLRVRTSKTDKDSQGRVVPIPPQGDPDPKALTRAWLNLVNSGFLLPRVSRSDELMDGAWRAAGVCDMVARCARDAHLPSPDRYTAHSLRAGGLTASLRAGTPAGVAARHGGWSPESAMVGRYARVADQWKHNAMRGVL